MNALDFFLKHHTPECRKATWHFSAAPCTCGRDQAAAELAAKDAEIQRLRQIEAERDTLLNALELIDHLNAGYVSELAREARRKVLDPKP